jgi:hypothetical protein
VTQEERWSILSAAVAARSIATIYLIPRNSKGKIERAISTIVRNGDWRRAERYVAEHFNQPDKDKQS